FGIAADPYPSSFSLTYEAGARTMLLGGRLSLEGSVFYNDVTDGHVYTFDPIGNQFSIKALDFQTYGFEAAARAKLTDTWTVYAGVGYVHASFVDVAPNDPTGAKNGFRVPGVPPWSGVVGFESRVPIAPFGLAGAMFASAELQLASRRTADVANTFDLDGYA